MKKKILAMTMSGAMAATMMTVGSTNAWAEPITVKGYPISVWGTTKFPNKSEVYWIYR
ncbi:hypothetical protein ACT7C9_31985 [Bacillus cereus]